MPRRTTNRPVRIRSHIGHLRGWQRLGRRAAKGHPTEETGHDGTASRSERPSRSAVRGFQRVPDGSGPAAADTDPAGDVARLFIPGGVIQDLHVSQMDAGLKLPDECVMFQANDSPQVFLLDHDASGEQIKRWITTAEAMERFQFDWAKIKRWDVPLASLG